MFERVLFSFRVAFKNIVHFKIRSLLMIFSFISLTLVVLLGLSMEPFVKEFYYGELTSKYRSIDFKMGVSENTTTRFFSLAALQSSSFEEVVDEYIPFFEMDTLAQGALPEKTYVKVFASSLPHLKKIAGSVAYPNSSLAFNEAIITKSLSDEFGLGLGDLISLFVGENSKQYVIVDVLDDDGLFDGRCVFLNKEGSLLFFLGALNPDLAGLNPLFLTNIYNKVYFSVKDEIEINTAIAHVQRISAYEKLDFSVAIDQKMIDQLIKRSVTVFNVIIILVFLAVFLVMQTTFLLFFDGKKRMISVVGILGGKRFFSFQVLMMEMLLIFLISSWASVGLANFIINQGFAFIGSRVQYIVQTNHVLFGLIFVGLIFFITALYFFHRFGQKSDVEQTKEEGKELSLHPIRSAIVGIVAFALYIGLETFNTGEGNYSILPGVRIVLVVVMTYFSVLLIFWLLAKTSRRQGSKKFHDFYMKVLFGKRAYLQMMLVTLISFSSILLLVEETDHMNRRIETMKSEILVDFTLSNFIARFDSTLSEIRTFNHVESADPAMMMRKVRLLEADVQIDAVVSMNPDAIPLYFNVGLEDEHLMSLKNTTEAVILLPMRFKALYGFEVGDVVTIGISAANLEDSFVIAGFFEKQFGNLAFFNIRDLSEYETLKDNAILVRAADSKNALKEGLINRYSKNLVFVLDNQEMTMKTAEEASRTTEYLIFTISVMIGCFVLAIFNHTVLLFEQMKPSFSRFYVTGASKKILMRSVLMEQFFALVLLTVLSIVAVWLISENLVGLILYFGEYEPIQLRQESVLHAIILVAMVHIVSRLVFTLRMLSLRPSEVLKEF